MLIAEGGEWGHGGIGLMGAVLVLYTYVCMDGWMYIYIPIFLNHPLHI